MIGAEVILLKDNQKVCVVDRFEGSFAVVEYGRSTFDLPMELLPAGVKEGDVLTLEIKKNDTETTNRKQKIDQLAKKLFVDE